MWVRARRCPTSPASIRSITSPTVRWWTGLPAAPPVGTGRQLHQSGIRPDVSAFGSEVSIVHHGQRLVSREDADVSAAIADVLTREGVNVRLGVNCLRIGKQGDDIIMTVDCGGISELPRLALAYCHGAPSNTDDLGLDRAG